MRSSAFLSCQSAEYSCLCSIEQVSELNGFHQVCIEYSSFVHYGNVFVSLLQFHKLIVSILQCLLRSEYSAVFHHHILHFGSYVCYILFSILIQHFFYEISAVVCC